MFDFTQFDFLQGEPIEGIANSCEIANLYVLFDEEHAHCHVSEMVLRFIVAEMH